MITPVAVWRSNIASSLLNNIVSYWKLDGNSNDSVASNNGTDTNITYTGSGKINQAANFVGTSYINVGSTSSFSFIQNTGVFSISFWMKTTSFSTLYYPFGNTPTSSEKGFFISKTAAGAIQIQVFNGTGNANSLVSYNTVNSVISDNNYHHIVIVIDKATTTVKIYKDSVLQTTGSNTSLWNLSSGNSSRTLNIGSINWTTPTTFSFNGSLDEIGIWNRVLTQSEITELYNSNVGKQYPF